MLSVVGLIHFALILFQFTPISSRIFERCELAAILRQRYGMPAAQVATLVCIAQHSSELNTAAFGGGSGPGGGSHGIFQISDVYWCSPPGQGAGCGLSCARLRDDDIADDVLCVRKIFAEHQRISGDGFTAWQAYNAYCRQDAASYVAGCQAGASKNALQVAASYQQSQRVQLGNQYTQQVQLGNKNQYQVQLGYQQTQKVPQGYPQSQQVLLGYPQFQLGNKNQYQVQLGYQQSQKVPLGHKNQYQVQLGYQQSQKVQLGYQQSPTRQGKIYSRCELAQELYYQHKLPMTEIPTWVCIAQHESSYNTAAVGRLNADGSADHGLFQISDLFWCTHDQRGGKGCRASCNQFLDSNIVDDVQCIRKIHEEHTQISGDGFTAWTVYNRDCRNQRYEQIAACFAKPPTNVISSSLHPNAIGSGVGKVKESYSYQTTPNPYYRNSYQSNLATSSYQGNPFLRPHSQAHPNAIGGYSQKTYQVSAANPLLSYKHYNTTPKKHYSQQPLQHYTTPQGAGKVYTRCELAQELYFSHKFPMQNLATWVCIAQHESSFNTAAVGRLNQDGSEDHGLFQISDLYWCSHDDPVKGGKGCHIDCSKLRDSNISDDVKCIQTIYEEHTRISGDGFTAWTVYNAHCRDRSSSEIESCFEPSEKKPIESKIPPSNPKGKIYKRCELAQELFYVHKLPMRQIPTWVCIAQHESSFNTAAVGRLNQDGSEDHGLFQISDLFWCTHDGEAGKACHIECDQLLDSDITDDVKCIRSIHEEHTQISGDGFNAWTVYKAHCQHQSLAQLSDCFEGNEIAEAEKFNNELPPTVSSTVQRLSQPSTPIAAVHNHPFGSNPFLQQLVPQQQQQKQQQQQQIIPEKIIDYVSPPKSNYVGNPFLSKLKAPTVNTNQSKPVTQSHHSQFQASNPFLSSLSKPNTAIDISRPHTKTTSRPIQATLYPYVNSDSFRQEIIKFTATTPSTTRSTLPATPITRQTTTKATTRPTTRATARPTTRRTTTKATTRPITTTRSNTTPATRQTITTRATTRLTTRQTTTTRPITSTPPTTRQTTTRATTRQTTTTRPTTPPTTRQTTTKPISRPTTPTTRRTVKTTTHQTTTTRPTMRQTTTTKATTRPTATSAFYQTISRSTTRQTTTRPTTRTTATSATRQTTKSTTRQTILSTTRHTTTTRPTTRQTTTTRATTRPTTLQATTTIASIRQASTTRATIRPTIRQTTTTRPTVRPTPTTRATTRQTTTRATTRTTTRQATTTRPTTRYTATSAFYQTVTRPTTRPTTTTRATTQPITTRATTRSTTANPRTTRSTTTRPTTRSTTLYTPRTTTTTRPITTNRSFISTTPRPYLLTSTKRTTAKSGTTADPFSHPFFAKFNSKFNLNRSTTLATTTTTKPTSTYNSKPSNFNASPYYAKFQDNSLRVAAKTVFAYDYGQNRTTTTTIRPYKQRSS